MASRGNGAQAPEDQMRELYEQAESGFAQALEQLVAKPSFGRLLTLVGENVRPWRGSAPIRPTSCWVTSVSNFWTTYRRLAQGIANGTFSRESYQPMAKWVADNPPFPGRAWAQWIPMMYRDDALARGLVRLRDRRVDLGRIDQHLLVVTAADDHIAPRAGTMPIFDLVCSDDVTHFDRPGGHIGLMAGSAAAKKIWPDFAAWLAERSHG